MRDMETIAREQDVMQVRWPFLVIWSVAFLAFVVSVIGWYVFLWIL